MCLWRFYIKDQTSPFPIPKTPIWSFSASNSPICLTPNALQGFWDKAWLQFVLLKISRMVLLPYRRIVVNNSNKFVMGSKYFLHKPSIAFTTIRKTIPVLFQTQRLIFSTFVSKPIFRNRGFSYGPQRIPLPGTLLSKD